MGDNHYNGDVAQRTRSTAAASGNAFVYEERIQKAAPAERKCHDSLNPLLKLRRECFDSTTHPRSTPVVFANDTSESRGKDVNIIFGKTPRFIGQLYRHDLVSDPELSICGIGDSTTDVAPIQASEFEGGNVFDDHVTNLWREYKGGGTGEEDYHAAAYFYAYHTTLDSLRKRGDLGWFFFSGDEAPYDKLTRSVAKRVFGVDLPADLDSVQIFRELQKKFRTFLIFPRTNMQERRKQIESEMKKRVEEAGAQFENVDVRFTLSWHNRNDLDLHCITPSGYHIFFNDKNSPCGGKLDVDRNVEGETTKPVENIRWKKGKAPAGRYRVFVRNFRFHEERRDETPFEVSVQLGGKNMMFELKMPAGRHSENSDILIGEFDFDPQDISDDNSQTMPADPFDNYRDEVVLAKWVKYIPANNIVRIKDPRAIVDAMLGIIAITTGKRTLEQFLQDLADDDQTPERIADIREALADMAPETAIETVKIPTKPLADAPRRSGTRRLN